jgi:hypothetical protein
MSAVSHSSLSSDQRVLSARMESSPASQDLHLRAIFELARELLQQLTEQRDEITNRIPARKQTILGLGNLFGNELVGKDLHRLIAQTHRTTHSGFTNACRTVLKQSGDALSARDVCSLLQKRFPTVLQHNNNLDASVTTILNRLVNYGEARTFKFANGRRVWQAVDRDGSSF